MDSDIAISKLTERVYELECELADERGEPRPGEDFRLEMGSMSREEVSYFAEDRATNVLVSVSTRTRIESKAKYYAYSELRRALLPENINVGWPSTDGVRSIHSSICNCRACGHGGLKPEDPPVTGFRALIAADA